MKQRQSKIKLLLNTSKKNSRGEFQLAFESTFRSEFKRKSTGYYCKKEDWNADKQKIIARNYTNVQQINRNMQSVLNQYKERMNDWDLQNIQYNAAKLIDDLPDSDSNILTNKLDLYYHFDQYISRLETGPANKFRTKS